MPPRTPAVLAARRRAGILKELEGGPATALELARAVRAPAVYIRSDLEWLKRAGQVRVEQRPMAPMLYHFQSSAPCSCHRSGAQSVAAVARERLLQRVWDELGRHLVRVLPSDAPEMKVLRDVEAHVRGGSTP